MTYFLEVNDLLNKSHQPVFEMFCAKDNTYGQSFVKFIQDMSMEISSAGEVADAFFWKDMDGYDRLTIMPYDGIRFEDLWNEPVVISYEELYYYMVIACKRYICEFSDSKETLQKALDDYCKRFSIKKRENL